MRKSTKSLFLDLHDLQQGGVALDTRILVDDGELAIHWPLLQLWGQWWSVLGQHNNNDSVDIKLEPHEIYDQVSCDFCEKVFNDKKALYNQ